jgi:ribosomal protein L37AE/L43A
MSFFKEKNTKQKKVPFAQYNNLSVIHQAKVDEFSDNVKNLENTKKRLENITIQIERITNQEFKNIEDLKLISDLKEVQDELLHKIRNVETSEDEMKYYFETSEILDVYNELDVEPTKSKINISDYFKPSTEQVSTKKQLTKKELLDKYLEITRLEYVVKARDNCFNFCTSCKQEMILKKQHGIYICTYCGLTYALPVDAETNKLNNVIVTDTPKYSIYQRKNHFREWLNQIQAKESTDIPNEVFDTIIVELNKLHFQNLAELNPTIIRKILKKVGMSKYYENAFHIIYRLNGLQPPTFSRDKEEKLLFYFKQIEEPFKLYKKKNRKNILRYSYILFKLCELLELDEFLHCFKLLKNRNKLLEQDAIWQMICNHLQWEFIPSI